MKKPFEYALYRTAQLDVPEYSKTKKTAVKKRGHQLTNPELVTDMSDVLGDALGPNDPVEYQKQGREETAHAIDMKVAEMTTAPVSHRRAGRTRKAAKVEQSKQELIESLFILPGQRLLNRLDVNAALYARVAQNPIVVDYRNEMRAAVNRLVQRLAKTEKKPVSGVRKAARAAA